MAANTISKVKREQRTGINMHNSHQAKDYLANTKKNSQKMVKKKKREMSKGYKQTAQQQSKHLITCW